MTKLANRFGRYLSRLAPKAGLLLLVFLFASLILFTAVRTVPGDPIALRLKNPAPERIAAIRSELGLDRPLPIQYGSYLVNFVRGNWGNSLITGRSVADEIRVFFPATLELAVLALGIGILLGTGIVISSQWSGWIFFQRISGLLGAIGLTVPIYWLGAVFIVLGSYLLGWFPVGGRFDFAYGMPGGTGFLLVDTLFQGRLDLFMVSVNYLFLPVLTLALYPAALVSGVLRARFADPRIQALLRALRAKGLAPWQIWLKHMLRLLGAPVVTMIGTNFGALLGGAVLTETVFSWPGMGRYLVEAVLNRDLFVIENGLLLVILLALCVVSLADMIAFFLNPLAKRPTRPSS